MTREDREKIIRNDFVSIILEYNRSDGVMQNFIEDTRNIINEKYAVFYFPVSRVSVPLANEGAYAAIPKLYGLLDTNNLNEMGVNRVQSNPFLGLQGEGVLLGFVDTGIDYTNQIFKTSENTSRIISIWDQTIENYEADENIFYYGTEYKREQINQALQNENPLTIVPSNDENGHGTMIAGITGGTRDEANDFQGVVQRSEFIIVKLKQAKQSMKDYFSIPEDAICFQQDDIMLGIQYLVNTAYSLKRPIAICIALGTNQGPHDGSSIFSSYISSVGNNTGIAILIAAGNEGNSKKHYFGTIDPSLGSDMVELNVGPNEKGFAMELWGTAPATYSIDLLSPSGEYIPQILPRLRESREIRFLFENTIVIVDYLVIEAQSGDPLVLIRFRNPGPGIWKFRVYGSGAANITFHVWLPMSGFISEGTFFLESSPDTTITSPGNTLLSTTVTAYNAATNSIYINASRGYTKNGNIKPDVAAPGVDVLVPLPGNKYQRASGTSIAVAHATGLAAMIMEWGIVRGNFTFISSLQIQRFLIRGVVQDPGTDYPNNIWGYGKVNIYNTFRSFSGAMQGNVPP